MNEMINEVTEQIYIMIPALNPGRFLAPYVDDLIEIGFKHILLVDDGSRQEEKAIFAELNEKYEQVNVLTHEVNKGKGRALKDGFRYLIDNCPNCRGVVTADSDGQHSPKDTLNVAMELYRHQDSLILGCRDFDKDNVPAKSKTGNKVTRTAFRIFFRTKITDTQTGLRGMGRENFEFFTQIDGERFEYETCMLLDVSKAHIPIREVTIDTIYIDNNSESHYRPFVDSMKIFGVMFGRFFRYIISSGTSAIIDIAAFYVLNRWVFRGASLGTNIAAASLIARAISSIYNFCINRSLVFKATDGSLPKQIVKYYSLVVAQILCSAGLVYLFTSILNWPATIVKVIVDTILFFVSYKIQSNWLFNKS